MSQIFSRRTFAAGSLAAILAGHSMPAAGLVRAQENGAFSSLDLPTLDITVTEDGFGGVDGDIEAGRYIVSVTPEEGVEVWGAAFVRPPDGITADQFLLELEPPTDVQSQDETAPDDTSPGDLFARTLPPAAYDATWAGGVVGTPDTDASAQIVVDIEPGEWILWAGDAQTAQSPLIFNATGEMPADIAEPEADTEVSLSDGTITMDEALPAGEVMFRVTHDGDEPHHLQLMKVPDGASGEEVEVFLRGSAQEEPEAESLPFDPETDVTTTLLTGELSGGASMWASVSLEAGTYVAVCFLPARESNAPHGLDGEYVVISAE